MKIFLGCFFLLFALFVITDLMSHVKDIFNPETDKYLWLQYYGALFSRRFDTLIPFSLLISSTILFSSIAKKNEQIPLLNGGLSMKRQLLPFFIVAILAMFAMWINGQYLYPEAVQRNDYISETAFGKNKEDAIDIQKRMGTMYLKDGSKLFFQQNDQANKRLLDVFWMPNHNTILHMETLSYKNPLSFTGTLVDILERDGAGVVQKTKTLLSKEMKEIQFLEEEIIIASSPARYMSLSQLLQMIIRMRGSSSEKASDIFITLLLKLLNPLTCLLTVSLPISYCFCFTKDRHPVVLLLFFIATLFLFQLFVQTSTVLARIPHMPSFLFLITPWAVGGFLCFRKVNRFLKTI